MARSLTGVLAYRLGGVALLERYLREDELLTSAGAQAYREMLGEKPVLILIDELAGYVAKAVPAQEDGISNIRSLLFDLIEAVEACPRAVLVITSPDPNADAFKDATGIVISIIDEVQRIIGRNVQDITPTAPDDLAPILRQRLFQTSDEDARQNATDAYRELYALHYPAQALELTEQIADSYPVSPTLAGTDQYQARGKRQIPEGARHSQAACFDDSRELRRWNASAASASHRSRRFVLHNELNSRLEQGGFTAAIQTDITGETLLLATVLKIPCPNM